MSLKPTKKSDRGKDWAKPRTGGNIRMQPEYHLLVTGGAKTEPAYFGAMRDCINKNFSNRINLQVTGAGRSPIELFNKTTRAMAREANVYKHIWIIYDTDEFTRENIDGVVQLCKEFSNEETLYHAIWSNQCIELWFLLHFNYMDSDLHREEYWPKLTDYLKHIGAGSYMKNRQDMFEILKPNIDTAIRNAKRLTKTHDGDLPSQSAPDTRVYELVEKLRPYII